jgi:hypothetical protein
MEESDQKGFDAVAWYTRGGCFRNTRIRCEDPKHLADPGADAADTKSKLATWVIELLWMKTDFLGVFMQVDITRWTTLAWQRNIISTASAVRRG